MEIGQKKDLSMCRLVFLLKERHKFSHRMIQDQVVNKLRKREGTSPLTDTGDAAKPSYRGISRMCRAGKETTDSDALEWAERMLPEILNEQGHIRERFVIHITAGAGPTNTTSLNDKLWRDAPIGLMFQSPGDSKKKGPRNESRPK